MRVIDSIDRWHGSLRLNQRDKSHIEALQQKRFRRLLHHTAEHSDFYRELYNGIDVDNCQLKDLPTVTKSAMMDNYDRLVTDERLKLGGIQRWLSKEENLGKFYLEEFAPFFTAGSTGEHAVVVYSRRALNHLLSTIQARMPLDQQISILTQVKTAVSHLLGTKARIAILVVPGGNFESISRITPPLQHIGANRKIISVLQPLDRIVEILNEFKPDRILTYSFFLATLAQEQLDGRLLIKLNQPMSFAAATAEPLTEHTKGLAFEAWNKRIQDCYGATEWWFMATSCTNFDRLHVMNDL